MKSSLFDLVAMRWLLLNVAGITLLVYGYETVWATFSLDGTYISEAIVAVFIVGFVYTGYRIWRVSIALNGNLTLLPIRREQYLLTTKGHIAIIRRLTKTMLHLGIAGTVFGISSGLGHFNLDLLGDTSHVGAEVGAVMQYLQVALITTLTAVVCIMWTGINQLMLEAGYAKLYLQRGG